MTAHAARCLADYHLAVAIREAVERGDRAAAAFLLGIWDERGRRMNGLPPEGKGR